MSSKLTLALLVTAVLMTLIVSVSIPAVSALTQRVNFNDNHCTARFSCGQKICGDHLCAPGEYDAYAKALSQAQMQGKAGNAPSSTGQNMTGQNMPPMTTTTPYQDKGISTMCETVKASLVSAGTSSDTVAKILASLGCR